MNKSGSVLAIYIAPKAEELPHTVERVRAVPGRGLDGDRYAAGIGTFSKNKGQRDDFAPSDIRQRNRAKDRSAEDGKRSPAEPIRLQYASGDLCVDGA